MTTSLKKQPIFNQPTSWLAPAKLNLFLHITGRRADGYHNLQTVFQLIDVFDTLTIEVNDTGDIALTNNVMGVEHNDNIIVKAATLLKQYTTCRYGATISVKKNIPMGAGLGGGSSDAATTLMALNQLWQTGLTREQLMVLGLQLGADVPIFIYGKSAWAEGIGEKLSPIELPEQAYLLVVPEVHCSTKEIFNHPKLVRDTAMLSIEQYMTYINDKSTCPRMGEVDSDHEPGHEPGAEHEFRNAFEPVVCQLYPEIEQTLVLLPSIVAKYSPKSSVGKINAKMTGTGAGVFVRIDPAQTATIRANVEVIKKELKKTSIFLIKSLSIHPHW